MRTKFNQFLSFLTALMLILSAVPVSAISDEDDGHTIVTDSQSMLGGSETDGNEGESGGDEDTGGEEKKSREIQYKYVHLVGRDTLTMKELLGSDCTDDMIFWAPSSDAFGYQEDGYTTLTGLNSVSYNERNSIWVWDYETSSYAYYIVLIRDYLYPVQKTEKIALVDALKACGAKASGNLVPVPVQSGGPIYCNGEYMEITSTEMPDSGMIYDVVDLDTSTYLNYGIAFVNSSTLPKTMSHDDGEFTYTLYTETRTATVNGFSADYSGNGDLVFPAEISVDMGGEKTKFTVTDIADAAFKGNGTVRNVWFDGAITIGEEAFKQCGNLGTLEFAGNAKISGHAFEESGVTKVTFKGSETTVGGFAFKHCHSLTSVSTLGDKVYVGEQGFNCAYALGGELSGIMSVGAFAFTGTIVDKLVVTDLEALKKFEYYSCYGHPVNLVLTGDTFQINHGYLSSTNNFSSITINANHLSFGYWALQNQSANLKQITINCPNAIDIGYEVFGDEKNGEMTIDINAPVNSIGGSAFLRLAAGQSAVTVNFNRGVGLIWGGAFNTSTPAQGTVINIGDNGMPMTVYENAIPDADGLTVHIDMPEDAVNGAEYLKAMTKTVVTFRAEEEEPEEPVDGEEDLSGAVSGETFVYTVSEDAPPVVTIYGLSETYEGDGSVEIPATFSGDGIEAGEVVIGRNAFAGEDRVTEIRFPDGVRTIGAGAFSNCSNLENVVLGTNGDNGGYELTIGRGAFDGCEKLETLVTVKQTVESEAGTVTIEASETGVPLGTKLAAESIDGNEAIRGKAAELLGDEIPYSLAYYVLSLVSPAGNEVKGVSAEVTLNTDIEYSTANGIAIYVLHQADENAGVEVISVGENYQAKNGRVTAVRFSAGSFSPFGVLETETGVFNYEIVDNKAEIISLMPAAVYTGPEDGNLTIPATLPDSRGIERPVTVIREGAFENETRLADVVIENQRDIEIQADAFRGSSVTSVTIGTKEDQNTKVTIRGGAFEDCTFLASFTSHQNQAAIETDAFKGCTALKTVTMTGNGLHEIKKDAFSGATGIETLRLDNPNNTEEGAFKATRGKYFIQGNDTALGYNLSARIGTFENYIFVNKDPWYFSGEGFKGNVKKVYLTIEDNHISDGLVYAIRGAGSGLTDVYIDCAREDLVDNNREHSSDDFASMLESANPGVRIHFNENSGTNGFYLDGVHGDDATATGEREHPFRTVQALKAALDAADPEFFGSSVSVPDEAIAELLADAFTAAGIDKTYGQFVDLITYEKQAVIIDTVTVTGSEEWDFGEEDPLVILRDPSLNAKPMIRVKGSLSLRNVILDGGGFSVTEPIILVDSSKELNIHEGAVLQNNHNTATDRISKNSAGAVYSRGTVNMDGGSVENNTAYYGGGISLLGGKLVMTGGTIANNVANTMGGGVLVQNRSTMTLSGDATITGNRADGHTRYDGHGGGIMMINGTNDLSQSAVLNMTGGTISENSSGECGGGLYIDDSCVANISAGRIINNHSEDGEFGGGGIYVNAERILTDGVLNLTDALITNNKAGYSGGAIAGCDTSTVQVFAIDGGAIYGNSAGDDSDIYVDTYVRGFYSGGMTARVSPYMSNGAPYHWTDPRTGEELTAEELSLLKTKNNVAVLKANPDGTQPTTAAVIITGNTAATRGGAIGTNGTVRIGRQPEPQPVYWTPDFSKVLTGRDMKEGEEFTFDVLREEPSIYWYRIYFDEPYEPVATGTVQGLKYGEKQNVTISPILLGEYSGADLGKTIYFTIAERPASSSDVISDGKYFLVAVQIEMALDEEGKTILAGRQTSVQTGSCTYDESTGKYTFDSVIATEQGVEHTRRVLETVENREILFQNYTAIRSASARKTWLKDGKEMETPPEDASVTVELLADDQPAVDADGNAVAAITLDGVADDQGEKEPWLAVWENLPVYTADHQTEIQYAVNETAVVPATAKPIPGYAVVTGDEPAELINDIPKSSITITKKVTGEIWLVRCDVMDGTTFQAGGGIWKEDVIKNPTRVLSKEGHRSNFCGSEDHWIIWVDTEGVPFRMDEIKSGATGGTLPTVVYETKYELTKEEILSVTRDNTELYNKWVANFQTATDWSNITLGKRFYWTTSSGNKVWYHTGVAVKADPKFAIEVDGHVYFLSTGESVTIEDVDDGIHQIKEYENTRYYLSSVTKDGESVDLTDSWSVEINIVGEDAEVDWENTVVTPTPTATPTPPPPPEEITEATIIKIWDDADNQDGKRPETLEVVLKANGKAKQTVKLSEANGWRITVKNLPKASKGKEIVYTWEEGSLPKGYTLSNTDIQGTVTTLTNSYTPEKTEVSVTKVWDDKDNQDGKRPDSIRVTLTANNAFVLTAELNEANGWTFTKDELDKYAGGEKIIYAWTEETESLPDGYDLTDIATEGTVTTLTNSYETEKTSATVRKAWNDNNNQDGKRPRTIWATLTANGEEIETVQLNARNNWSYTRANLDKYSDGKLIEYKWTEDTDALPKSYELTDTSVNGTITTFTNTHVPETVDLTVKKVWNDDDNRDGLRPVELTVTLSTGDSVVLSEENGWTASVRELPKYAYGEEIHYTWTEKDLPAGYELTDRSVDGTVTTLTNTHIPETVALTVKKAWDDDNNRDGIRPTELTVALNNGTEVVLKAANGWSATVENLPKYENGGEEIHYEWQENGLPEGYELTGTAVNGTVTTLTNRHVPEKTVVTVRKVWNDSDNQDGKRPESITVTLRANGEAIETVELNEANNWVYTRSNLNRNAGGEPISYVWTEDDVPEDYELTDVSTNGTLTRLTNSYETEKTSATVLKVWDDDNNRDGVRPESIRVALTANGAQIAEATLNAGNNWTWTENNLDAYAGGELIRYEWTETGLPEGYELTGTTVNGTVTTLTNRHVPAETEVSVVKVWDDNDNQDGIRPETVTVTLSNGMEVVLSEENEWSATVTGLPKYENGAEIEYVWTEAVPDGYTLTDIVTNGAVTTLRNTHEPETVDLTVRKVWADNNNGRGLRPAEIRVTLSTGLVVTLNAQNAWTYTVTGLPAYEQGTAIAYTWTEQQVAGYTQTMQIVQENETVLTNRIIPVPNVPEGNRQPDIPDDEWEDFDEYETALGGETTINHVGDCFD